MAYSAINKRNKNITSKKKEEYKTAKRHTCRVITGKGESRVRAEARAEAKAKHKNAIKVVRREGKKEGKERGAK